MAKKRSKVKFSIWLLSTKSWESPPISSHVGGVKHIVGKLSMRATTLLKISPQSKVYTQSYEPRKLQESQFWEFQDSHLGVSEQNGIWVLAPWLSIKNTIWGKVVASPKSGPWWVLWVHGYPRFVRASKVFQLCINQLVIWFVKVYVSNWLICQSG
jgi:hypothetical protein